MSLLKTLLLVVITVISLATFQPLLAQASLITWFEKTKIGSEVDVLSTAVQAGDYYYSAGKKYESKTIEVTKIDLSGEVLDVREFDVDPDASFLNFHCILATGEKLYVIYDFIKGNQQYLLKSEIHTTSLQPSGQPIELAVTPKGNHQPGEYTIRASPLVKDLHMEDTYFNNGYYHLDRLTSQEGYLMLKLVPGEAKSNPVVNATVYDPAFEVINTISFSFPGTHVDTEILAATADAGGNIFLLAARYENKTPSNTLIYHMKGTAAAQTIAMPSNPQLYKGSMTVCGSNAVAACLNNNGDVVAYKFDALNAKFFPPATLAESSIDRFDLLLCYNVSGTPVVVTQNLQPAYTGSGMISEYKGSADIRCYGVGMDGKLAWKKSILSRVSIPASKNDFEVMTTFLAYDNLYVLFNNHPDNAKNQAANKKLKTGMMSGNGNIATEIARFDAAGNMKRKQIYLNDGPIMTVPLKTMQLPGGKVLVLGDSTGMFGAYRFGTFTLSDPQDK